MANYADKLVASEQVISDFIFGKVNVSTLEQKLSADLSNAKFFNRPNQFEIILVKNNGKEPFFGARVYPALDYMEMVLQEAVMEAHPFRDIATVWHKIDKWVIELDSQMFDRNVISLVPGEIMAAILHEIGHTVYSDKVLERFYRAFKSMHVHMKAAEKDSVKLGYALFAYPLSISCGLRSWVRGRNAIREEFFADKIVKDCGYGEFYYTMLDKIISAYGSSIVEQNDTADDNKVSERCRWAAVNIVDTTRRRQKLGNDLYLASAETRSNFLHAMYARILNLCGVNLRERYSGDAVESVTEIAKILGMENAMELYSFDCDTPRSYQLTGAIESCLNRDLYKQGTPAFESLFRRKAKEGLPSWVEIDRIDIEIDRMSNHHDRTFVLDMIYNMMNEINDRMEIFSADQTKYERYRPEAERMLKRLQEQRDRVLSRRTFANKYQVYVQSPEGYEG